MAYLESGCIQDEPWGTRGFGLWRWYSRACQVEGNCDGKGMELNR